MISFASFTGKKFYWPDTPVSFSTPDKKIDVDLLIVSKSPKIYIAGLATAFNIKQIVFDGSVPFWKLLYWKKDCDSLHIPYYDVSEKGAFVMNLN